jgi:hypothetical protein
MNFQPTDFKNMLCNIYELPDNADLFIHFKNQLDYPEYKAECPNFDKQKIIRYIAYAYDKNSPLHRENDLQKRKKTACELAKIKGNDKQWLAGNTDKAIRRMIVRYVKQQNNIDFATLMGMWENYWNVLEQVMSREVFNKDEDALKDSAEKTKLSKQLPEMSNDIKAFSNKVFYGDTDLMFDAEDIVRTDEEMSNIVETMTERWEQI